MLLKRARLLYRCMAVMVFAVPIVMIHPEVRAETPNCPPNPELIESGFRAYRFKGVEAAVTEWTYKSSFAASEEAASLVKELTAHRNFYGDFKSYRSLGVDRITPNTRIEYVGAGHERGELFFKFIYYCEKDEWVLSDRPKMNADPDSIFSQNHYLRLIKELQEKTARREK
jgi:hypothetical protein